MRINDVKREVMVAKEYQKTILKKEFLGLKKKYLRSPWQGVEVMGHSLAIMI